MIDHDLYMITGWILAYLKLIHPNCNTICFKIIDKLNMGCSTKYVVLFFLFWMLISVVDMLLLPFKQHHDIKNMYLFSLKLVFCFFFCSCFFAFFFVFMSSKKTTNNKHCTKKKTSDWVIFCCCLAFVFYFLVFVSWPFVCQLKTGR